MRDLCLLTILHLLVDGVCGAVLAKYALQEPNFEPIVFYFGLYTVFAFGLQGVAGWLLDRKPMSSRYWLLTSTLLLALGSLPQLSICWQTVLLGLGNCFFHVVGGSFVLRSYNTYSQLGLFVCSGAIGLGLGLYSIVVVEVLLALAVIFTLYTVMDSNSLTYSQNSRSAFVIKANANSRIMLCGVATLLFTCIILRGFGSGEIINSPSVMLLPCTFALGKLLGGIICDKVGYRKTVLLIFGIGYLGLQFQGLWGGLFFILSCNMTMPLTLRLVHWCRIGAPGLMFGLAATCLVPGTIFKGLVAFPPQLILVLQFLILFVAGYILLKEEYHHE